MVQSNSTGNSEEEDLGLGMQFMYYKIMGKKGEGTFSQVLKAQSTKTGKYVAIKCMKNVFDGLEQVNRLREIQALRRLSPHPNIIKMMEVLYDKGTGKLALVFELMDKNIYELIGSRKTYLPEDKVKSYMYQLIKAMDHMHRNGIFHRDIKPENILILNDNLKLADFGSCRGIYSKQPFTEYISTRWYRAPECLLTDGYYDYKMDMWGVGCVFFEIVTLYPLFPGNNEVDQIHKIHNIMGTPPPEILSKFQKHVSSHISFDFPKKEGTGIAKLVQKASPECLDLMEKLLAYNPEDRITARQALRHPYFKELRDLERKNKPKHRGRAPEMTSTSEKMSGTLPTLIQPQQNPVVQHHHQIPQIKPEQKNVNNMTLSSYNSSIMQSNHQMFHINSKQAHAHSKHISGNSNMSSLQKGVQPQSYISTSSYDSASDSDHGGNKEINLPSVYKKQKPGHQVLQPKVHQIKKTVHNVGEYSYLMKNY